MQATQVQQSLSTVKTEEKQSLSTVKTEENKRNEAVFCASQLSKEPAAEGAKERR